MSYNFYIDKNNEDNIVNPYSKSQDYSEQHTKFATFSVSDISEGIIADSENKNTSLENNLESKENIEKYNPTPQFQNQRNMDQPNVTQSRECFNNQASQEQPNSQQNQMQCNPTLQFDQNGCYHPQSTTQDPNNTSGHAAKTGSMSEYQISEQSQSKNQNAEEEIFDPDNLPPFKSDIWDLFQFKLKDKEALFRQKDYPRKPLMIDADLYSTLREIDIDNIAPTNLLNVILRTFVESFKEELRQYRKIQAPSVF